MIVAVLLGSSGLFVIAILLVALLRAIPNLPSGSKFLYSLRLRSRRIALYALQTSTDKGGKLGPAAVLKACYLEPAPVSPGMLTHIERHHMLVLQAIAPRIAGSDKGVAILRVLEVLFHDRTPLLRSLYEADQQIRQRKTDTEKRKWALAEFQNKRQATLERLVSNAKNIENKLEEGLKPASTNNEETLVFH